MSRGKVNSDFEQTLSASGRRVMKEVSVFAPGTIANVGPGFDCLGLALADLGDKITVRESLVGQDVIKVSGRDSNLVPLDFLSNCAGVAATAVRQSLADQALRSMCLEIEIERSLPLSGGLGASAASSVGAALACAQFFALNASKHELINWALEGEESVAGRHLDNIVPCLLGGLTLSFFRNGQSVFRGYECNPKFYVVLVTPRLRIETKEARRILPTQVSREIYVAGMSRSVAIAMALRDGDSELVRESLEDPYAVPLRKTLIALYDAARQVALESGALGFCISGSGPTLFALCDKLEVANDISEKLAGVYSNVGVSAHVCRIANSGAVVL